MKGNTVSIKGNITRDAEFAATQSGTNVASFGICWNRSRKNAQGGYDDVPNFFDVVIFLTDRQLGYLKPQLVKGASCAIIDGHLSYSSWEKDGQKLQKLKVRAMTVKFLPLPAPNQSRLTGEPIGGEEEPPLPF